LLHGEQVREKVPGQSREGDARAETRHAQKRRLGQEGDEPQAGHRHRTFGSASRRRQGAVEEGLVEEVVFIEEGVVVEEGFVFEESFIEESFVIEENLLEEIDFEEVVLLQEVV
jgi:hypothetical protein